MDLYTSLTRLKQELNGGRPVSMTPLTPTAAALVDSGFVEGMGGLIEDERLGLRCPMKGCGEYCHNLSTHWRLKHGKTVGPVAVLREAMSLPKTAKLISSRLREQMANQVESRLGGHRRPQKVTPKSSRKGQRSAHAARHTMGYRNLRNACDSQMCDRYLAIKREVGAPPTEDQCRQYDKGFVEKARYYYGSLNAFKMMMNDRVRRKFKLTERDVLEGLECYFDRNGQLPTYVEANTPSRLPLIHTADSTMKALGMTSWEKTMSHVAWVLGVDCPRYSERKVSYLSSKDVAAKFDVTEASVKNWCRDGLIAGAQKGFKGKSGCWLIPESALDGFVSPDARRAAQRGKAA